MTTLFVLLTSGLVGGLAVALAIALGGRLVRRRDVLPGERRTLAPASPALINMAHIRVEGLGGLGMLAIAVVVALFEPSVRSWMQVAAVLGLALAGVLIAWRRRVGPLPSEGSGPGAHSMFPLESPTRIEARDGRNAGLTLACGETGRPAHAT